MVGVTYYYALPRIDDYECCYVPSFACPFVTALNFVDHYCYCSMVDYYK